MVAAWDDFTKRYGIDCFLRKKTALAGGTGIASQFFDSLEEADAWAEKAQAARRFKYLVCYDSIGGTWEWSHDYDPQALQAQKAQRNAENEKKPKS
jgi:hypothetical protein